MDSNVEFDIKIAWNTLNIISNEYNYMWDKLDKLELVLYQQQNVISQLLSAVIESEENVEEKSSEFEDDNDSGEEYSYEEEIECEEIECEEIEQEEFEREEFEQEKEYEEYEDGDEDHSEKLDININNDDYDNVSLKKHEDFDDIDLVVKEIQNDDIVDDGQFEIEEVDDEEEKDEEAIKSDDQMFEVHVYDEVIIPEEEDDDEQEPDQEPGEEIEQNLIFTSNDYVQFRDDSSPIITENDFENLNQINSYFDLKGQEPNNNNKTTIESVAVIVESRRPSLVTNIFPEKIQQIDRESTNLVTNIFPSNNDNVDEPVRSRKSSLITNIFPDHPVPDESNLSKEEYSDQFGFYSNNNNDNDRCKTLKVIAERDYFSCNKDYELRPSLVKTPSIYAVDSSADKELIEPQQEKHFIEQNIEKIPPKQQQQIIHPPSPNIPKQPQDISTTVARPMSKSDIGGGATIPENNLITSITNSVFQGYHNVMKGSLFKKESTSPQPSPVHKQQQQPNDNIKNSIKNIFGGFKSLQESMTTISGSGGGGGSRDDKVMMVKNHQYSLPETHNIITTATATDVDDSCKTVDVKFEPESKTNSELKAESEDNLIGEPRRMSNSGKMSKLTSRAQTMQEPNTMIDTMMMIVEPNQIDRNKLEKRYSDESMIVTTTMDNDNLDRESMKKLSIPNDQIEEKSELTESKDQLSLPPPQTSLLDVDDHHQSSSKSSSRRVSFEPSIITDDDEAITSPTKTTGAAARKSFSLSLDESESEQLTHDENLGRKNKKSRTKWIVAAVSIVVDLVFH